MPPGFFARPEKKQAAETAACEVGRKRLKSDVAGEDPLDMQTTYLMVDRMSNSIDRIRRGYFCARASAINWRERPA